MEPIIEWNAPEHYYYKRSSDWYWAVGIIAATCAVLAFIFDDVIFGILIAVAALALCLHASIPPRMIRYQVNDRGIVVNDVLYPFLTLHSFWIEHNHPEPKILIKSQKFFMPFISVPIDEVNPEEVRAILLRYIAETEHIEPLSLKLLEAMGF
jgi:hypothetical protein